jgi:hypothetical protein
MDTSLYTGDIPLVLIGLGGLVFGKEMGVDIVSIVNSHIVRSKFNSAGRLIMLFRLKRQQQ